MFFPGKIRRKMRRISTKKKEEEEGEREKEEDGMGEK